MFFSNNEKIKDIVMRTEITAPKNGVSVFELLKLNADEIRADDAKVAKKIAKISDELAAGRKRKNVYRNILDKNLLQILLIAEENKKKLVVGDVFESYEPIRKLAAKYKGNIKKTLYMPLASFAALSMVFSSVLQNFKSLGNIGNGLSETSMFIINNYLYITGTIFIVIAYLFMVIPHKLPLMKQIFTKLDSMLALSIVVIMMEKMGYSSSDVIPMIKKQFHLKVKRRIPLNAKGLVILLKESKFITAYESAEIKIAINYGKVETAIKKILEEKQNDVEALNKLVEEIINKITLVLTAIPILIAMIVFNDVLQLIGSATK